MGTRRTGRGDLHPVPEQCLYLGLELGEVEVGTAVLHGDYQLGGVSTELDRADPVPGRQLGQETSVLSEQAIICGR